MSVDVFEVGFHWMFHFDLLEMDLNSCMIVCYLSSRNQQVCRASYVTTSYNSIRTFLVGCEKSRVDVVEVFLFWGFAFVFWLTPSTLTVLCVSTRVTGLLDFHSHRNSLAFWTSQGGPCQCVHCGVNDSLKCYPQ